MQFWNRVPSGSEDEVDFESDGERKRFSGGRCGKWCVRVRRCAWGVGVCGVERVCGLGSDSSIDFEETAPEHPEFDQTLEWSAELNAAFCRRHGPCPHRAALLPVFVLAAGVLGFSPDRGCVL